MDHVALVTGLPLSRNPRVVKEATTLVDAGYRVTILGPSLSRETDEEDATLTSNGGWAHQRTVRVRRGGASSFGTRVGRRIGAEVVRRTGLQLPDPLGYAPRATLRAARALNAHFYIGHLEIGLWVAERLNSSGRSVGADLEDWYSEDLLPEARAGRPVGLLRSLEAAALTRSHVTTTSVALADALAREYGSAQPTVVYNAFPWRDRERLDGMHRDRVDLHRASLHWVSQTIGKGRGLETLFSALHCVDTPVDLHIRGACEAHEEKRLRTEFPEAHGHRLFIHPVVSTGDLLSRIAEHDIGLALEPDEPLNKLYTVSNKVLHYLLAGLAVVATDTAGQREVAAAAAEAVRLCRPGDPSSLAAAIDKLLSSPERLAAARSAALEAARSRFCWERQSAAFLASVQRAMNGKAERACVAS